MRAPDEVAWHGHSRNTPAGSKGTREAQQRIDHEVQEGAKFIVDRRGFKLPGYEEGFWLGGSLFDHVTTEIKVYKEEIVCLVLGVVRVSDLTPAMTRVNDTSSAPACRASPAMARVA